MNATDALWQSERLVSLVPPTVRKLCQTDGHYYAVPVGLHRVNLVWYDKSICQLLTLYHVVAALDGRMALSTFCISPAPSCCNTQPA